MPGIETGLDRRGAQAHPWQGRPADLPLDPTYAISDDKLNANWRQLMEAIGVVLITGQMCQEGTDTYGASTTTYCRLTIPDGFTEQYDWLHIGDGTRQWRVQVAVAREISFSDAELIDGTAGTANYNTIQNDLMMWTLAKAKLTKKVTKNEISLGAFDESLHGDDMRLSKTDATTVTAKANLIDVEHESDGTHSAGIIGNAELDKDDVLITQGFVNRVRNSDFNINNIASREYWLDFESPTVVPTGGVKTAFPFYYLDITTDALDEGIYQYLSNTDCYKSFEPGVPIRAAVYLKGASGGESVKISLVATSSSQSNEIELTDEWAIYYVTLTATNLTQLYFIISANTAEEIQFYVAKCLVANGDIHTLPERSTGDIALDICQYLNFHITTLVAGGDTIIAQFTPHQNIQVLAAYAYAVTAPDEDVTIRLTTDIESADNLDVTILDTAHYGENTAPDTQEYVIGNDLYLKVLTSAATTGGDVNVVIVYRMV